VEVEHASCDMGEIILKVVIQV